MLNVVRTVEMRLSGEFCDDEVDEFIDNHSPPKQLDCNQNNLKAVTI
jgi:hypothetical protein